MYKNRLTSGSTVNNFSGANYVQVRLSTNLVAVPATGSIVLSAGTYQIGYCVYNGSGSQNIDLTNYVNGRLMVTYP